MFPSNRVLSNELALRIRWPKYWSFSFSISLSKEYSGLISFRTNWFDLLAVQGTLKSLLQHHSSKASPGWGQPTPLCVLRCLPCWTARGGLPGGGTCGRETTVARLQGPCPLRSVCPCLRMPYPWAPQQRHMHRVGWQVRPRSLGPREGCRCPRGPRHRVRSGSCLFTISLW